MAAEPKEMTIKIDHRTWYKWVKALGAFICLLIAPVILGAYLDSVLLELVGLVLGMMILAGLIQQDDKKVTFTTIEDAIKYLETLKAKQ